ncbi:MAG: cytochrome-c peroxidase [Ferruginibacter sp.]|nr:cytochrome-c peroxidase [Cytophagales bacterium]
MKRKYLYAGLLAVGLVVLAFFYQRQRESVPEAARVKIRYRQAIQKLDSAVVALKTAVEADRPLALIQRNFRRARLAYKQVEFLAEYLTPVTAKSINGAPIDEVEADDPLQTIVPPEGFQVVEEYLFAAGGTPSGSASPYPPDAKPELQQQINVLLSNVRRLDRMAEINPLTDRYVFDAMRLEVFRVITLGISGFDSPVAFHSLPEAAAALGALEETFGLYRPRLLEKSPQLVAQLDRAFRTSRQYVLANRNFDRFDRATFIRGYANSLSGGLLDAQRALDIPAFTELRALSAQARTLFDPDAFNPNYYAPDHDSHLTPERVALGELLFFDPLLSGNGSRSCASCHNPRKAFADGEAKSVAFDFKGSVARNAPTVLNAGLQRSLFHDLRVTFLEDQATDVLSNATEMHGSLEKSVRDLAQSSQYTALFGRAFPRAKPALTERNAKVAIASYVRSLVRLNARFDQYMRGDSTKLTALERDGFNMFLGKAKCGTCHFTPLFNGTVPPAFEHTEAEIIGVPATTDTLHPTLDPDEGKFALHRKDLHRFAFKTPTVRNVGVTAPYMHNGVYQTLEEVMDFYNRGGGAGMGIDLPTQTLPADPLNLTTGEKKAVIAFLHTLTDTTATTSIPRHLPSFPGKLTLNQRKVGGTY